MKTTYDFCRLLEIFYQEEQGCHEYKETRLGWLCGSIFQIWTYDAELDDIFSKKAIEVCEAISSRKTFDYIEGSKEDYIWYIQIVNMPFFSERIEWGTSIRGAWWQVEKTERFCHMEYHAKGGDPEIFSIEPEPEEWEQFIQAIIQFSKES